MVFPSYVTKILQKYKELGYDISFPTVFLIHLSLIILFVGAN